MNKVCGPTRIILYILIFLIGSCILVYGLYRIASWMNHLSCGDSKTSQTVYLHPDSTDQHKIDSLQFSREIKKRDDSIAVLNHIIIETEQTRSDIQTKYITRTKIIEITNSSELYSMNRYWLSPGRVVTGKTYPFDSLDMMSLAKKHAEYDYFKSDRDELLIEKSTYENKINLMSGKLDDQDKIISLKDDQIGKMVNIPIEQTIINKPGWYVYAGIIAGSLAVGWCGKSLYNKFQK